MAWVINNGPWTFNSALLVMNIVKAGEDPVKVALHEVDFWIQIYDLPVGYMTKPVGKQLDNFFGSFLQYDAKNNLSIWRVFMRVRIRVDVRKPLKRKKKIVKKDNSEVVVNCKYEKLGDFCFICGMLSHTERFCKKKFESRSEAVIKEWGHWLRAPPRRAVEGGRSKWLREEDDGDWGRKEGKGNHGVENQGFQTTKVSHQTEEVRDRKDNITNLADNRGYSVKLSNHVQAKVGNSKSGKNNGLDSDELYGLNLEERKRQRSEAHFTISPTE